MKKRLLLPFIICLMMFVLVSCGKKDGDEKDVQEEKAEEISVSTEIGEADRSFSSNGLTTEELNAIVPHDDSKGLIGEPAEVPWSSGILVLPDELTIVENTEEEKAEVDPVEAIVNDEEEDEGEEGTATVTGGNHIVAIDPGHQSKGNNEQEPIGPGASQTKAKVAGGTRGVTSGVPEYQLTLDVSLKLRDILVSRGYKVVMIRESNDVNISNAERAKMAADAGAEVFLRIHADGSDNQSAEGMMVLCPTANNPYCSSIYSSSRRLSDCVLRNTVAATGAKSRGVSEVDNMSGINWSTVPVTIVEMGFMTNPNEDRLMQTDEYQRKLANGMADGVDSYFSGN